MENGCKFSINGNCIKCGLACRGNVVDKRQCYLWGETAAIEDYYAWKKRHTIFKECEVTEGVQSVEYTTPDLKTRCRGWAGKNKF